MHTFNAAARLRLNPFFGPPDAYWSFIHAEDAGAAVDAALRRAGGIYNVADDEPVTAGRGRPRSSAEALGVKPPQTIPAPMLRRGRVHRPRS